MDDSQSLIPGDSESEGSNRPAHPDQLQDSKPSSSDSLAEGQDGGDDGQKQRTKGASLEDETSPLIDNRSKERDNVESSLDKHHDEHNATLASQIKDATTPLDMQAERVSMRYDEEHERTKGDLRDSLQGLDWAALQTAFAERMAEKTKEEEDIMSNLQRLITV